MRILITGGAGFLGSHLCAALIGRGDEVVCADNLSTGRMRNITSLFASSRFRFAETDVTVSLDVPGPFGAVVHLASPASPPDYLRLPLETLAAGSAGTRNALEVARRDDARFVLASTSEVYGDPAVHPQPEDYWGNVNPIGTRSVYDEAKRFAEALTAAYARTYGLNCGVARIFNTYGPGMRPDDGRVVTNLIGQALAGEPLTIYGDGSQTRSLCYVDDMTSALIRLAGSGAPGPVNLGNPGEVTMLELAAMILALTGSGSPVTHRPLPADDPARRCPDISVARDLLGWEPAVPLVEGLTRTITYFRRTLGPGGGHGELQLAQGRQDQRRQGIAPVFGRRWQAQRAYDRPVRGHRRPAYRPRQSRDPAGERDIRAAGRRRLHAGHHLGQAMGELRDDIPGWEGTQGPFPGQYAAPHVYARDIRSGAGNCVCGADLWNTRHVMAAPGVPVPGSLREQISFMIRYIRQRYGSNTPARPQGEG